MKTTLAWITLGLMASGCSSSQAPPAPKTPRIPSVPGAILSPPAWLTSPHVDIAKFFALPPEAENAAPLYLDALFEFAPEMAMCFPWGEPERTGLARSRKTRLEALYKRWDSEPESVTLEEIDDCLATLSEGFRKIDLAQERKSCVFAIGLNMDSNLPHAQDSRLVAWSLALKTHRDLARGDLKAAVKNVGVALRLSRDLRPRGPMIVQMVSAEIDSLTIKSMVLPILNNPKFAGKDCRRLIELLVEHREKGLDLYRTAIEAESLMAYESIHSFEFGRRTVAGPQGEPVVESDAEIDRNVAKAKAKGNDDQPIDLRLMPGMLAMQGITSLAREYRLADEFMGAMFSVASELPSVQIETFHETSKRLLTQPGAESYKVVRFILPHFARHFESAASSRAMVGGALCAASVRLWRLTNKAEPADLAAVCKAAGLKEVPIDPFSLAPFRLTKIDGADVVYSIGGDEQDDEGLIDSEFNSTKPGDFLFKLR